MIRCRNCGKPVGAGTVKGGDLVACERCLTIYDSDCDLPEAARFTPETAHLHIKNQMARTKVQKVGKRVSWW